MVKNLSQSLVTSRSLSLKHFGKKIRFYIPSFINYETAFFKSSSTDFPSISITGQYCPLKCKHCSGRVLRGMIPAITPKKLFTLCQKVKEKGGKGCLISGGCLSNGSVPIQKFIDTFTQIKEKLGLTLFVHTGIINEEVAKALAEARVDAALIDVIGSQETIKKVYNLEVNVDDYETSLRALHYSGISFVPHIIVGLHYGKLMGEIKALEMISKYNPHGVVVIALIPLPRTPMARVPPPPPEDVLSILVKARIMMPTVPLALGCMRPKGNNRIKIDTLAVRAGVNAIAFPTEEAINLATLMNLDVSFSSMCCSQIHNDFK